MSWDDRGDNTKVCSCSVPGLKVEKEAFQSTSCSTAGQVAEGEFDRSAGGPTFLQREEPTRTTGPNKSRCFYDSLEEGAKTLPTVACCYVT